MPFNFPQLDVILAPNSHAIVAVVSISAKSAIAFQTVTTLRTRLLARTMLATELAVSQLFDQFLPAFTWTPCSRPAWEEGRELESQNFYGGHEKRLSASKSLEGENTLTAPAAAGTPPQI